MFYSEIISSHAFLAEALRVGNMSPKENLKILENLRDYYVGITKFQESNYQREVRPVQVELQIGSTKLLNYVESDTKDSPVVLFVPSLINKSYILDLEENCSLMRYLGASNIAPYLVDFNEPRVDELEYGCADYLQLRILKFINYLYKKYGRPIYLAGYCLGGTLSIAAAQICQKGMIKGLALVATPWDFTQLKERVSVDESYINNIKLIISASDKVPPPVIQTLFYFLDPDKVISKFIKFGQVVGAKSKRFMAVERWLNDGISITKVVAMECMEQFIYNNITAEGKWQVGSHIIKPQNLDVPVFLAIPRKDSVVSPESTYPLISMIKNKTVVEPSSGHIGLIIGRNSVRDLWEPLTNWLKT
jgi:poly[(R)-3-hydroxyalkanoate] polymerase subunit PhaC